MNYITNSFSLNMLSEETRQSGATIRVAPVSDPARYMLSRNGWQGAIGHADTRDIVSGILWEGGAVYPPQPDERPTVSLESGDTCLVAQYIGPRLPEGATRLPDGARMEWYVVEIE